MCRVMRLRKRRSYVYARAVPSDRIRDHRRLVALQLCVFREGDPRDAVIYLSRVLKSECGLGFADDLLQQTVQTLFLTATDSEFIAMDAASTVHHWRARNDAIKVCADLRVGDWVSHLNNTNGIAPSSAQIYDRFCLEVNNITERPMERELGATALLSPAQRSWARRWRLRWMVTRSCIIVREDLLLPEMQAKAKVRERPSNSNGGLLCGARGR